MVNDKLSLAYSIYHGGNLTREVSFDRAIINIGKLSTSNLRLNDVNASRKHTVVERLEERHQIVKRYARHALFGDVVDHVPDVFPHRRQAPRAVHAEHPDGEVVGLGEGPLAEEGGGDGRLEFFSKLPDHLCGPGNSRALSDIEQWAF